MKQVQTQDPKPYLKMKDRDASPHDVYKKALEDGYKKSECMILIAGIFELPMHQAREIGHQIYRESLTIPKMT